jgi:hypothetical protein
MNRLKLSILGAAAAIPAAGIFLASAAGPNLVQNGDFSNGVAGWSNFSGNPQAVNGAMQLANGYQGTGNSYFSALQCVTGIQEGVNYTVKGNTFIEPGQTPFGAAGLYLHFHTGENCDGSSLGGGHTANGFDEAQRGYWLPLSHTVNAPAGAKSVYIRPTALKEPKPYGTSAPETLVVLFDDIEFFETNSSNENPNQDDQPAEVEEPGEDPTPEEDPTPQEEPQPDEEPQPEETPVPEQDQPADEPQDEPEDTPEVPEVPEIPQVPEWPEFPGPDGGDEPVTPEEPQDPQPQAPQPQQPGPQQPSAPEQPDAPHEDTAPTPEVKVPLPPATGTGPVAASRGTIGILVLALGSILAGLGSVAAAASIRRR